MPFDGYSPRRAAVRAMAQRLGWIALDALTVFGFAVTVALIVGAAGFLQ
jgi:hypothetical protein